MRSSLDLQSVVRQSFCTKFWPKNQVELNHYRQNSSAGSQQHMREPTGHMSNTTVSFVSSHSKPIQDFYTLVSKERQNRQLCGYRLTATYSVSTHIVLL